MVLANFDQLLDKYAKLLVNKGIGAGKDDYIKIFADIEIAPLVRRLVDYSYQAGAAKVMIDWADDTVTRLNFMHQSEEVLKEVPQYVVDRGNYDLEKKTKRISLRSGNPNALKGIDPSKITTAMKANSVALKAVRDATQANVVSWLVAAGAGKDWAALVFPDLKSSEEQVDALWDQIFKTNRVYEEDPIKAWESHEANLIAKAEFLNKSQFDALHYTAPGTDLTIGLPKNHVWETAGSKNAQGQSFMPNMPTEEVFTAPDCNRADGHIISSKPLAYGGHVIDGMTFYFEDGKITKVTADEGEEVLRQLVEENEGARQLGEVALVPHKSPISQSGIIFFNTLFDENASNHIAIGQAYPSCVVNGTKMNEEELLKAGLNRSTVHVDFMVGNAEMDVDGIMADGTIVPIFRKGEWAI